jgi:hypothetical protein
MHSSKSCLRGRCRRSVGSDFQITSKVELFFHRCIFLLRVGDQEVNIPNKNRLQAFFFYSVLILDSHTAVRSVNQNPIHNAPLSPVIHLYENLSLNPVPLLFLRKPNPHKTNKILFPPPTSKYKMDKYANSFCQVARQI